MLRTHRIRFVFLFCLAILGVAPASATEPCKLIHGRAHLYGGDGQLRIWEIGTHHDYEPDSSSWSRVENWLLAGVPKNQGARWASPASMVNLFADFVVCPTKPLKKGAVQPAIIKSATHRRYTRVKED
jgi:hypothetical protein